MNSPAACQERNDGEHLCGRAELQDWEQVREVVPQHVAGDRDGVQALSGALAGPTHGVHRRLDGDVQTTRVVLLQIGLHLGDQATIVRAMVIQPEDGRRPSGSRPRHRQPNLIHTISSFY